MEPINALEPFKGLRNEIGSEAYLSVSLNLDFWESTEALVATVYPSGTCDSFNIFRVYATSFDDLLIAVCAAWEKNGKAYEAKVIRDMALAIIRITSDMGHCTDASLKAAGFDKDKIAKFSMKAAKDANNIASNGPFKVIHGSINEAE